jgi:hypothetical protein
MDARARKCAAALGAISAVTAAGLGAGPTPAPAATVQEEREACKAKITARRQMFGVEQIFYRERFKARQAGRRAAYVAAAPHTREENQRFIRMMDKRKLMFHELMERRQQRFNERMRARAEECQDIGRFSAAATAPASSPGEVDTQSDAEEARLESEPLLAS